MGARLSLGMSWPVLSFSWVLWGRGTLPLPGVLWRTSVSATRGPIFAKDAQRPARDLPYAGGRHFHAMSVIPVTVFLSLLLAGLFVVLFAREQRKRTFASAERESLLPLADETPRVAANESEGFPPN